MRSFVIFKDSNQYFGIDIENVKRILLFPELTDNPDEDEHIIGIFQYEDEILKVMSFAKIIESDTANFIKETQRCLILTDEDDKCFGLSVELIEDIIHVKEDSLHIASEDTGMGSFIKIEAILDDDGKLITIVKDITISKREN